MNPELRRIFKRKNKYNAISSKCALGHYHPSRLESGHCALLQLAKKQGIIQDFIYAKKYELIVNGKKVGSHRPDFTVITHTGLIEVHETKGMATADWILRKNIFEAIYPEINYMVVH